MTTSVSRRSVSERLRTLVAHTKGPVQFHVPDDEETVLAWEAFKNVPSSLQDLTKVAQCCHLNYDYS